ncbi:hypothetical protein [Paraburkholderia jirisanensis]
MREPEFETNILANVVVRKQFGQSARGFEAPARTMPRDAERFRRRAVSHREAARAGVAVQM